MGEERNPAKTYENPLRQKSSTPVESGEFERCLEVGSHLDQVFRGSERVRMSLGCPRWKAEKFHPRGDERNPLSSYVFIDLGETCQVYLIYLTHMIDFCQEG